MNVVRTPWCSCADAFADAPSSDAHSGAPAAPEPVSWRIVPKILHTADWHLGKRLKRFELVNEQREALERLLDVIDAERPDVVVIAGDVFDVPERQPLEAIRTWTWITQEITRRAPIVAIPGNHDHAERIGYNTHLTRTSGLYILNDLERAHEGLVLSGLELFGLPFHKPARVRALLERDTPEDETPPELDDFDYDAAMRHLVERALGASRGTHPRVAIAHAFVAGSGEEDSSEDPIMVGGAGGVHASTLSAFDYVALGHLHAPHAASRHAHVRYAGSLYPYAFDEHPAKSVTIAHWDDGATAGTRPEVRTVPLEVRRRVRVIANRSFADLLREGEALRSACDPRVDDYLMVSVTDRDPVPHAQARLNEVYPNAVFEQRWLDVAVDEAFDVPDPSRHSVEQVFEAFYTHVYGADERLGELERAVLRDALHRLESERDA